MAIFLLTMASMSPETDLITRGARQGKIRQPPKIMRMISMRVLNPLNVENHPPKALKGSSHSKFVQGHVPLFFGLFLELHPWHVELLRLGV